MYNCKFLFNTFLVPSRTRHYDDVTQNSYLEVEHLGCQRSLTVQAVYCPRRISYDAINRCIILLVFWRSDNKRISLEPTCREFAETKYEGADSGPPYYHILIMSWFWYHQIFLPKNLGSQIKKWSWMLCNLRLLIWILKCRKALV